MAFRVLKEYLGLRRLWGTRWEVMVIVVQTWARAYPRADPWEHTPVHEVAEISWQGLSWPPPEAGWIMDPPRYAHKPAGNANRKHQAQPQVGPSG